MANNTTEIELSIDDTKALKVINNVGRELDGLFKDTEKRSKEVSSIFGNAFRIDSITDIFALTKLLPEVFQKVKDIASIPLNEALKAEEIRAVNQQFDILARQAGLVGDVLKSSLEQSVDGLVDMEDALALTSKSIVALGENAEKVPELFLLARQAASVFGGTAEERFEAISRAIESGNTKALKQIGLVIDQDAAMKNYAKSLGLAANELVVSEKQTAILNAVLEKGATAFKNVDVNARELDNNTKRLNVSLGELGDTAATAFDRIFGQVVKDRAKESVNAINELNLFLRQLTGEAVPASEQIDVLSKKLEQLQKFRSDRAGTFFAASDNVDREITALEEQIKLLERRNLLEAGGSGEFPSNLDPQAAKAAFRQGQSETRAADEAKASSGPDPEIVRRNQERLKLEQDFQAELAVINEQADLAAAERQVQLEANDLLFFNNQLAQVQSFEQQKLQLQFDAQAKKIKQMEDGQKKTQALELNEAQRSKAMEELRTKQALEQQRLRQQNFKDSLSVIATLQSSSSKELFFIGKAAATAQATIDGIAAVQKALSSAPPPFNFAIAALVGVATAANIAKIASAQPPGFAEGGIVGGNSFIGDRVPARVNSGEMILTKEQQATLFAIANGQGPNSTAAAITALGDRIAGMNIVIQANAREIARLVRDEREAGFA